MEMTRREALAALAGIAVIPSLPAADKKISISEPINAWCQNTPLHQAIQARYKIWEKWQPTGLLNVPGGVYMEDGLGVKSDLFAQMDLAVVLENQRLFNEAQEEVDDDIKTVKRVSIPLTARFWGDWIGRQMFNTWGMLGPQDHIFYQNGPMILVNGCQVEAEELPIKTSFNYLAVASPVSDTDKEKEIDLMPMMGSMISEQLLDYAFDDIVQNCPVLEANAGGIAHKMELALLQFHGQLKEQPDWLACDQDTCEAIGLTPKFDRFFTTFAGNWPGLDRPIKVFCRPWKRRNAIFGCKKTYFDSGYTMAMYTPAAFSPIVTTEFGPGRIKVARLAAHKVTNRNKFLTVKL